MSSPEDSGNSNGLSPMNTDGNMFNIEKENENSLLSFSPTVNNPKVPAMPGARRNLLGNFMGLPESNNCSSDLEETYSELDNEVVPTPQSPNADHGSTVEADTNTDQEVDAGDVVRKRCYTAPEKLTKKRSVNPAKWKRNVAREQLARGEEHLSPNGVKRRGRSLQQGCDASCRLHCQRNVTPDERQDIFDQFWKIPHQKELTGRKLEYASKVMFLDTLDVCDSIVETTVSKIKLGGYISPDKRRAHYKKSPQSEDAKVTVRLHIQSVPRMPSHYSRETTNKEYVTEHFQSVTDLFGAYKEWMLIHHPVTRLATERQYRDIFNTKYNISFFLSKTDTCDECTTWTNTPPESRE
ncbi:putative chorismate mutase [Frankliniella fusca]|uniref:Chorismate mutase n=1 Tax=Frankliniella fusca TaxID=407009 RepID=A0AAE1HC93_9NEOP|nr:putative chorismate mutase [Frankliniella fusca]